MNSYSHITGGIPMAVITAIGINNAMTTISDYVKDSIPWLTETYNQVLTKTHITDIPDNISVMSFVIVSIGIILFLFALILPDIDKENSLISQILNQTIILRPTVFLCNKFKHHHWTHTIWLSILPFIILGQVMPIFYYMAYGCFIHLILDSFGRMGNCWFLPIYKQYQSPNGIREVKPGHKIKLYRTGSISEYICCGLLWLIMMALLYLIYFYRK